MARGRAKAAGMLGAAWCALAWLGGCDAYQSPKFEVARVVRTSETSQGAVIEFEIVGTNPNEVELPLHDVRYAMTLDGRVVFRGVRSAEATLPAHGTQIVYLPVSMTAEEAALLERDMVPYALSGRITYELPGSIAETFFDAGIRRPTVPFGEAGRFNAGDVESAPVEAEEPATRPQ